jgi:mannose-6-phosphate isomerase-like protein (cupin superfamily)
MTRSEKERLASGRPKADRAQYPGGLDEMLERLLSPMALAGLPVAPPEDLWRRIEASIEVETEALAHRIIEESREAEWVPIGRGIEIRRLWNKGTHLLRCQPGAVLAAHLHTSEEHLIVLSGDLVIGGRTFLAGDHICSPPGMDNVLHHSRQGCLLLCQMAA